MIKIRVFLIRYFRSIVSCCYLFLLGWTKAQHRAFLYSIGRHFGWEPESLGVLPMVDIDDITSSSTAITIHGLTGVKGNVALIEMVAINRLIKEKQSVVIVEIGTFDGRTTLNMAANTPPTALVHTLDLPPNAVSSTVLPLASGDEQYIEKSQSGACFSDSVYSSKIKQLYGDSAVYDFTPFRRAVDFVFVDGAHSYDYVMSDSRKALDMIGERGGIVLWHDYGNPWWPDVTRAIDELYKTEVRFENIKRIRSTTLCMLAIPAGRRA